MARGSLDVPTAGATSLPTRREEAGVRSGWWWFVEPLGLPTGWDREKICPRRLLIPEHQWAACSEVLGSAPQNKAPGLRRDEAGQ